jgi:coatomer subunit beta
MYNFNDNNDNNIVLKHGVGGCVQELKERHRHVMQAMLMDVLRALATPNMDIRKKTLDIALDLITQQNIDEVRTFPLRPLEFLQHM